MSGRAPWPVIEDEDTDVTEVPLRAPAPAEVVDRPRDPDTGAQLPAARITRPYRIVGGRVVLDLWGGRLSDKLQDL